MEGVEGESGGGGDNDGDGLPLVGPSEIGGIHWLTAGLLCVGSMAGAGIVALPFAVIQCQFWPGLAFAALVVACTTLSAVLLGKCWTLLQRHWPEYRSHCRQPYGEIAYCAMGPRARTAVLACTNATLFGVTVVFLLLCANNIHDLLSSFFSVTFSPCFIVLIVGTALLPLVMLKSPKEFSAAILIGMASTALAVILLVVGGVLDWGNSPASGTVPAFDVENYFLTFGTYLFTFGGLSAFPTIQHDMKKPHEFTKSSFVTYTAICALYLPVVVAGYIAYGTAIGDSMISSIGTRWIRGAVNVLVTLHCLLTVPMLSNPPSQWMEELLGVPQEFGWRRVAVRTSVMAAAVFIAESIPNFGALLNLVGGSTVMLASFLFPPLFYLFLSAKDSMICEEGVSVAATLSVTFADVLRRTRPLTLILCGAIVVVGLTVGGAATFSAIKALTSTKFTPPCYFPVSTNASICGT